MTIKSSVIRDIFDNKHECDNNCSHNEMCSSKYGYTKQYVHSIKDDEIEIDYTTECRNGKYICTLTLIADGYCEESKGVSLLSKDKAEQIAKDNMCKLLTKEIDSLERKMDFIFHTFFYILIMVLTWIGLMFLFYK